MCAWGGWVRERGGRVGRFPTSAPDCPPTPAHAHTPILCTRPPTLCMHQILPKIKVPIILVNADGDDDNPGAFKHLIDHPRSACVVGGGGRGFSAVSRRPALPSPKHPHASPLPPSPPA